MLSTPGEVRELGHGRPRSVALNGVFGAGFSKTVCVATLTSL